MRPNCQRLFGFVVSGGGYRNTGLFLKRNPNHQQTSAAILSLRPMCDSAASVANGIAIQRYDCKRVITLTRPEALNALNLEMIRSIYPRLQEYEAEPDIKLVIMKGAGDKAFCAGGDIKSIVQEPLTLGKDFFREEYKLNYLIGTYEVPYIAFIDGITMGGGVGLSVHGKYRVATERTVFAMPETAIGFFPDVGGSYFLPRLHGRLGMYLALTGHRLKGEDVLHAGVATHYCRSDLLDKLEFKLTRLKPQQLNEGHIESALKEFQDQSGLTGKFSLEPHLKDINTHYDRDSVQSIVKSLEAAGGDWASKQLETMQKMSPTSMAVTFEQLSRGAQLNLREIFTMEYRICQKFVEDRKDFFEGVRALLIDKDQNPKWDPPTLDTVDPEKVLQFFSPLPDERELNVGRLVASAHL